MATMGRTPTGESPSVSFRPPRPLLDLVDELRGARSRSDVLVEAMHLWVERHEGAPAGQPEDAR